MKQKLRGGGLVLGAAAASVLAVGYALAQAFNPPEKITVTAVSSSSVTLQMPPLPTGATSLTLQRGQSAGTAALPSETGRVLWLNADAIVGTQPNGGVSAWGNIGTGTQASQSNADFCPTLVPGALNGHSVVRFDGVNDYLSLPSGMRDFSQGISTFIVAKPTASPNNAAFVYLGRPDFNDDIGLFRWGTSNTLCHLSRFHSNVTYALADNTIDNGNYNLLCSVQQGGASNTQSEVKIYKDSSLQGTGQAVVPRVIERTANSISSPFQPSFQGDIAEVIVYNRALSESERHNIEAYLSQKYGFFSSSPATNWTTIATGLNGGAAYEDTNLSASTAYSYRAVGVAGTDSAPGPEVAAATLPSAPAAPAVPTFGNVAASQLVVNAPDLPLRATHLSLQRKLATAPDTSYVTLAQDAPAAYTDSGLTAQTGYAYRYLAVGTGGVTPGSSASVTTVQTDPPSAPLAPSVQSVSTGSITLKMPALPAGATSLTLQKSLAPAQSPSNPPTTGLTLWLKANSVGAANNSPVATWPDSSGNGNDATQTDSNRQPVLVTNGINGLPIVHLDGNGDYLNIPPQTGVRTAIVVARHTTGNQDWNPILGGVTNQFHGGQGQDLFSPQWTSDPVKSAQAFEDGQPVNVLDLQKPTDFHVISLLTSDVTRVDSLSAQLDAGRTWNGDYAEVLLYDHVLSTQDREQAEGYLKAKYQIGGAAQNWTTLATGLSANALYPDLNPTVNTRYYYRCVAVGSGGSTPGATTSALLEPPTPPLAPPAPEVSSTTSTSVTVKVPAALSSGASSYSLQRADGEVLSSFPASGLQLHLNASSLAAGAVDWWNDSSGNSNATQQSGSASCPTLLAGAINGRSVVHFDGWDDYLNLPAGMQDFGQGLSAFVVTRPTSNAFWSRFFDFANGSANDNILFARLGGSTDLRYEVYSGNQSVGVSASNVLVNGSPQIVGVVQQGGTPGNVSDVATFYNGTQASTGQANVPQNLIRNSNYVGKSNWPDALFQGDMAEILLYNRALTSAETQGVQAYLAAKYNIGAGTVPTTPNWTTVATGLAPNTNRTDSGLTADTHYLYRFVAVNAVGSSPGKATSVVTSPLPPSAPQAPSFSAIAATHLTVDAAALPARASGLALQQKLASDQDASYVTLGQNVTAARLVEGLTAQTTYSFRFVATGEGGSTPGTEALVRTADSDDGVTDVGKVAVLKVKTTSVVLQMPALPTGATSLTLQRAQHLPPTELPAEDGRVLWLKADSLAGLGTGSPVSQWGSIGTGQQMTQVTETSRPLLVAPAVNGRPVVRFDGVDDYFDVPAGLRDFSNGVTAFVIAKPSHQTDSPHFFDFGNGVARDNVGFSRDGAGTGLMLHTAYSDQNSTATTTGGVSDNVFQEFGVVQQGGAAYASTAVTLLRNGVALGQGQCFVPRILDRSSNFIGKSSNGGDAHFKGDIAEIIVYNRALSETERQGIEAYLSDKYDMQIGTAPSPWTTVATGLAGNASYQDAQLSPDTRYFYRAVAVSPTDSVTGPATALTTLPPAPAAPGVPTFSEVTAHSVRVGVPALPDRATNLWLQRKLATAPDSEYVTLTQSASESYVATDLTDQTSYAFRYVAVGDGGQTEGLSATVETHQVDPPSAPLAPSVQSVAITSVDLKMPALPYGAATLSLQRAVAPAQAPQSPPTSGLTVWLKADSIAGVDQGAISTWNDSSGSGNNATVPQDANPTAFSADRRPLWIASGLNGKPVVRLDGVDDYFRIPAQANVRTAIVVARHKTGLQDWAPILGSAQFSFHGGDGDNLFAWSHTSNAVAFGAAFQDAVAIDPLAMKKPTSFHVLSFLPQSDVSVDCLSNQEGWNDRAWNGDYAEVLLYNRALTTTERAQAEAYLNAKYGLGDGVSGWDWTTVATGLGAGASYHDANLSAETHYLYRCVAVGDGGSTPGSVSGATTLPIPPVPDAPAAPEFSDLRVDSVQVSVPAMPAHATSLKLQRKLAGSTDATYYTVGEDLTPDSWTTVDSLTAATAYSFRFVATGPGGSTPGESADVTTPAAAISGFQWSSDGEQWNPVLEDTVLRVERFSHIGLRAVKTTPNSPWPGGLSGPVWSWQGTHQEGEEVWLTGEHVTNGAPDLATALLFNQLAVKIRVLPKLYLYMSTDTEQVSAPPGEATTDAVPVTIVAKDTDGAPVPFLKVRVSALNAKDQVVGLWGTTATSTPSLILTADAQGQIQTNWFGPDSAGHVQLKAVAVDADDVPFGDGDSKDITVVP